MLATHTLSAAVCSPLAFRVSPPTPLGERGEHASRVTRFPRQGGRRLDKTIRLVVLEDHKVIGTSLAVALSELPDIDVVGVATSLREVRELIRRTQPDIVLADADLGDEWSLELPLELGRSGPRVLFLAPRPARRRRDRGRERRGWLHPQRRALRGGRGRHPRRRGRSHRVRIGGPRGRRPRAPRTEPSRARGARARGARRGQQGDRAALGIEDRTVETHIRRLFDRYGISNRVELAVLALREGWVDVGI